MALSKEDLQAIAGLFDGQFSKINDRFTKIDNQFAKINDRLDIIELKQDRTSKKLDDLQLDVKIAERDIRRDIRTLQDETETIAEILKQHDLIPL